MMETASANAAPVSPGRLLEMLADRFGAFEAIAMASIKLARHVPEDELSMDMLVAAGGPERIVLLLVGHGDAARL